MICHDLSPDGGWGIGGGGNHMVFRGNGVGISRRQQSIERRGDYTKSSTKEGSVIKILQGRRWRSGKFNCDTTKIVRPLQSMMK